MKKIVVLGVSFLVLFIGWFSFKHFSTEKKEVKLILLGLDGADWDIIDPYIQEGKLPTFKRLKEEGTWGYLDSIEPTLSPMLWTTIATGKRPDQHGIVDFLEWDDQKKERLPMTSHHRKVPAIWNILSHQKLEVGIFNWLISWPAEKINGVLVSDRLGYHVFPHIIGPRLTLEQVSFPKDYAEKNKNFFVPPEKITYEELSKFIQISKEEFKNQNLIGQYDAQNPDMHLRLTLATFKTFKNFAFDYWTKKQPHFLALYFDIPDSLMHTFMDYAPPKLNRVSLKHFQKYKDAVCVTYEKLDQFILDLLNKMDPKTHLMIVSDHGFKFGKERLNVSASIGKDNEVQWHDKKGIILFWGERFQNKKQILNTSLYDIVPTVLRFFNLPIAQDMSGQVLSAAFKPDFFDLNQTRESPLLSYDSIDFGPEKKAISESYERDAEIDESIKERLASLGYIQPEEESKTMNRFQTRNPFLEAVQFQKVGRTEEAAQLYLEILKENPANKNAVSIYNSLSLIYRNKGDYQKAKEYLQKALKTEKDKDILSNLYVNFGNLEKQFGYLDQAVIAYQKARKIDPQNGMADYAMGILFEEQEKWNKAEEIYKHALSKNIDIESLPSRIMLTLEKQHKTQELKKMYQQFTSQESHEKKFQFLIGESQRHLVKNRLNESLEALFEALRLQPKNAIVYNDIGGIFLKQNNKEKAIAYFKRAQELDPGNILPYLNLASAYLELSQFNASVQNLQKALKINPQNIHAYYLMGITQRKLKKYRLAKFNFKKVLELDPSFSLASQQLKMLETISTD